MSLSLLYLDFDDDTVLRIFMFIIPPISIVNNRTPFETELSDYAAVDMRAHRVLEFFWFRYLMWRHVPTGIPSTGWVWELEE